MTLIIFLIILSVLVIAHELGHFVVAKLSGMRVDEFGLGYPPKAKTLFRWRGVDFTLNWLPFGGFVKIFGENPTEETETRSDSFQTKNRGLQSAVLVAGVTANIILAWLLMSIGFMIGLPASIDSGLPVSNPITTITQVVPKSPADMAGVRSGDQVVGIMRGAQTSLLDPVDASSFITKSAEPVTLTLNRGKETLTKTVTPTSGIVEGKFAVGIALDSVGIAKFPFFKSFLRGAQSTWVLLESTAIGLWSFLTSIFHGHANLSEVSGPVGLIGLVGDARSLGFVYLLSFTALISLNLAVLNLLPIPALDGGRLLFVIIEAVRRKPVSAKIFNAVNNVGFSLLLILMALITVRDVLKLL